MRSFAGVAITAQHLQIVGVVGAAFGYWVDVVYFKRGTILGGNTAHLAAVIIALKNFKAQAGLDWLALGRHCPLNKRLAFMLRNLKSRSFTT